MIDPTYRHVRYLLGTGAAILGAAGIGAASSLLGNIFGASSQSSANATNLKIAQMNNEFNERMLQKQMDYNTEMFGKQTDYDWKKMQEQNAFNRNFALDMFNRTNEYNTAANQRKRLEEAGLNPYLMMNGGSAGTATSTSASAGAGGSPSAQGINPPTATPVQVQAYRPDFSGINQVIAGYMDYLQNRDLKAAQATQVGIQNNYLADQLTASIAAQWAETKKKNTEIGRMQALLPHEINQARWSWQNAQVENKILQADVVKTQLDGQLSQKALDTFDENFRTEMAVRAADVAAKYASGLLSRKQAELAVKQAITEGSRNLGIQADTKTTDELREHLVDSAFWNAKRDKYGQMIDGLIYHNMQNAPNKSNSHNWSLGIGPFSLGKSYNIGYY